MGNQEKHSKKRQGFRNFYSVCPAVFMLDKMYRKNILDFTGIPGLLLRTLCFAKPDEPLGIRIGVTEKLTAI